MQDCYNISANERRETFKKAAFLCVALEIGYYKPAPGKLHNTHLTRKLYEIPSYHVLPYSDHVKKVVRFHLAML